MPTYPKESAMPDQKGPQWKKDDEIQDLPNKPVTPNTASVVKGGRKLQEESDPPEDETGGAQG
jgi:hypothetical protein